MSPVQVERKSYQMPPQDGFTVAHFLAVADIERSARFYETVFEGRILSRGDSIGAPAYIKIANTWLIVNVGGGPTPDKPSVTLRPPADPNLVNSFMNIRVADIQACFGNVISRASGSNNYEITFAPGKEPPVNGSWSLTLYNDEHLFRANELKRFSLGTKNKNLMKNPDGSLTLYAGAKSPGKDKENNWLPAPDGAFLALHPCLLGQGRNPRRLVDATSHPEIIKLLRVRGRNTAGMRPRPRERA
jgi:hypothetical protein